MIDGDVVVAAVVGGGVDDVVDVVDVAVVEE